VRVELCHFSPPLRVATSGALALLVACAPDDTGTPTAEDRLALSSTAPPSAPVVTLLTGDRVRLQPGSDGASVALIEPAPGREAMTFMQRRTRRGGVESLQVIPGDAAPIIAAGRLDAQLFDVAALIRQGLDDQHAAAIPLIVRGSSPALTAARRGRTLPSIGAGVVAQDKATTGALWASLTAPAHTSLAPVTEKVWLDGIARPVLAESAPQVGAPSAWELGLTGAGVTVAVLDTGVDATHPDLQDRVALSRDFTGTSPEALDDYGHGTHVAGTIAGTGAASSGRYRGVAPDVAILNGRVCVSGSCQYSDIIAGMEWAATNARIVNVSLGGEPSDGTDPLSLAVDALSAEHGTLFVIAAGNAGDAQRVAAPGAATRALTVGSVTKQDELSPFSSRGPRFGDSALKPDIAAPGSDIVAARARGTVVGDQQPVDDHYAMASGTSMATPHVAAAAAILAQRHPDWDGEHIKAALTSAAHPIAASIYGQGAGRLDVARAIAQPVRVTGNLGFGLLTWPHEQAATTRTVTLHNDGDAAVVLDLALRITDAAGNPAPAGVFALDASRISVPPGERRDVAVTMQPLARTAGLYGGWLEASNESVRVVAAIGAEQEPERYELRLRQHGRDGRPATVASAYLVQVATGDVEVIDFEANGTATRRVAPGVYHVIAILGDPLDEGETRWQQTVVIEPELTLAADTTIELDAARAQPLVVTVDRPGNKVTDALLFLVMQHGDDYGLSFLIPFAEEPYLTTTRPTVAHPFSAVTAFTVMPADPASQAPYRYDLTFLSEGHIPATAYRVRDRELARVDARYHAQGVPVNGVRTNWTLVDGLGGFLRERLHTFALPSRRAEYFTPGDRISRRNSLSLGAPSGNGGDDVLIERRYDAGSYTLAWNAAPLGPGFGNPESLEGVAFWGSYLVVRPGLFSPGDGGQDAQTYSDGLTGSLTVWRDGEEIGRSDSPGGVGFEVPPGPARYAIEIAAQRRVEWSNLESDVHVRWDLTAEPSGSWTPAALPILVVRASGPVDESSVAPAGVPYALRLVVDHQVGSSPVTALALDVSYDEGARWQRAPVVRIGNQGFALLVHPRRAGTVSLRARATDATGATVDHTTIQSYRIAPWHQARRGAP
jgi:subtilisin family serine protease